MSGAIDAQVRRQMVAGSKAIGAITALLSMPTFYCPQATRDSMRRIVNEYHGVPEPAHCRHPDKCAGKSGCPRDPVCID